MKRISLSLLTAAALTFAIPGARAAGKAARHAPSNTLSFFIPAPRRPAIATAGAARDALRRHGMAAIRGLGRIGDYWEAEGLRRGRPVVGYAYRDGEVSIRGATPEQLVETFGRLPLARSAS